MSIRIAVIGTGLIGGSVLSRLHSAGYAVTGWDPSPEAETIAASLGLPFTSRLEDAVHDCGLAVFAGPLSLLPQSLSEVAKLTGDGCLLTDVGSTKGAVVEHALREGFAHRFVPGHPMAGSERSGLAASSPSLLDGCPWVLCPAEPLAPFRAVASLLIDVFRARIMPMRASTHDAAVGLSSHVPHVFAGALAGAAARSPLRRAVLGLAAGSFKDGTRVAGTAGERIVDMLSGNREAVAAQLRLAREVLDELAAALDDEERLLELFAAGRGVRRELEDEPGAAAPFSFGSGDAGELEFLLGLGERGGYLTRCDAGVSGVAYTAVHTPRG